MIFKCDRILIPDLEDDKLKAVEQQRMKRLKCVFDIEDVSLFNEFVHNGKKYIQVHFYYNDPVVIDFKFDEFEKLYAESKEDEGLRFWYAPN